MESATNQDRDVIRTAHFPRPPHRGGRNADEISIEQRVRYRVAGVLLPCGDHQRCAGNAGVQEIAETVAESAGRIQVDDARSTSRLGVAVCHSNRAGLLQRQDVSDIRRVDECIDQGQFRCPWIAKDVARALASQHFKQDGCPAALT